MNDRSQQEQTATTVRGLNLDTLFYRKPRLLALILSVQISAGMFLPRRLLASIGRQEDPMISNLSATITTLYPGADLALIESLVTRKIETVLNEIATL